LSTPILEPTLANVAEAAKALRAGKLVAFPTETVYGLGGDATNDRATAAIFALKGRPRFNPLIVHVLGAAAAAQFADVSPLAERAMRRFWPGALTLILPRRRDCKLSLLVSAGLDSVALRAPAHPVARALIMTSGLPLAGPSANPSGRLSPTCARDVQEGFTATEEEALAYVLDGGPSAIGLESTVLSLRDDQAVILRPGAILAEDIAAALDVRVGIAALANGGGKPLSPGQLESHYAPDLPVRLNVTAPAPNEALLAFGASIPQHAGPLLNLSAKGDLTEAAANLFAMLRALDRHKDGVQQIAVMPIPEKSLGLAINDRLRRAAAPRNS